MASQPRFDLKFIQGDAVLGITICELYLDWTTAFEPRTAGLDINKHADSKES